VDIKRQEWMSKLEKQGIPVDLADLEQKEALGEIQPYERDLIPNYEQVSQRIERLLENPQDYMGDD
jgi:hypothetical protein